MLLFSTLLGDLSGADGRHRLRTRSRPSRRIWPPLLSLQKNWLAASYAAGKRGVPVSLVQQEKAKALHSLAGFENLSFELSKNFLLRPIK